MSAAPSPKKTPVRRVAHEGRSGALDRLSLVAGLVLCLGIGYIAYRTQVCGEPLDRVLPFLAADRPAPVVAPAGPTTAETIPDGHPGDAANPGSPAGSGKSGTSRDDPDNTYFGRREHRSIPGGPR